jgi:hypothetical protein
MSVRTAVDSEIDLLADIWYQGWQDAHERIMPAALTRARRLLHGEG